jgi:hypothetical protein
VLLLQNHWAGRMLYTQAMHKNVQGSLYLHLNSVPLSVGSVQMSVQIGSVFECLGRHGDSYIKVT